MEGADEDSLRFGEARFVHGESCTGGGALDSGRFPVGPCRCGALGYPECRAPGLLREAGLTPAFSKAGQGPQPSAGCCVPLDEPPPTLLWFRRPQCTLQVASTEQGRRELPWGKRGPPGLRDTSAGRRPSAPQPLGGACPPRGGGWNLNLNAWG